MTYKLVENDFRLFRKAFTLIEMLVVIAIISILASMLTPALQNAIGQGKATVCMNNLKQCSQTMVMYSDDFNGFACVRLNSSYDTWSNVLKANGYFDSKEITNCHTVELDSGVTTFQRDNWLSYAIPFFDNLKYYQKSSDLASWFIKTRSITPKVFVFLDGLRNTNSIPFQHYVAKSEDMSGNNNLFVNTSTLHMRHLQRGNVAFFDTHVEALSPEVFSQKYNEAFRTPFNEAKVDVKYFDENLNLQSMSPSP